MLAHAAMSSIVSQFTEPPTPPEPRIAIVHDWLDTWRGGEMVLAELLALFPQSTLFSIVDFLSDELRARIGGRKARTSFIQKLPGARRHFRRYLPLMPAAIAKLPLESFDAIISSSHAVAKGAPTGPRQLHVCLCYTPMRYAWDLREQYLATTGLATGPRGWVVRRLLDRLRDWDIRSAGGVDRFVAISQYIAGRIGRCYGRDATVIYPPVDVEYFTPAEGTPAPAERTYYLAASQMVPYKRMDLIVEAFRQLPERRLVVVGTGPEEARTRRAAGSNAQFLGEVPRPQLRELMRGARAFVFAAEEDFGLLPVEAQACGTPVIAYGRGGLVESIVGEENSQPTGMFFLDQSSDAIASAVRRFEREVVRFDAHTCRRNANRFSAHRFRRDFRELFDAAWSAHTKGMRQA